MYINIKPDPDFARLRKTLLLEGKADRVPLFDFNVHDSIKAKIIQRPLVTPEDEIDFWICSGYDYIQIRLVPKDNISVTAKSASTSHGRISDIKQLLNGEFDWTPFFKNTWRTEDYNLDQIRSIVVKKPQNMKLIVHAADIFSRSWISMGFEDFCYALFEEPEMIAELFRQNAIAELRMLEVLFDSFAADIGALLYSDDLAYTEGLMVSADVYRQYLWPYLKQVFDHARRLNIPVIYHTDGRLWEVFDDFIDLGVNAIQPLEPKSMDLSELKRKRGHQFCLIGSIDIDTLSRGNPKDIDDMVRDRIRMLGYNGGYVVGTSNTVPDYVNVENYKTMIEAAYKYGLYANDCVE